jgi:hypothetical protein
VKERGGAPVCDCFVEACVHIYRKYPPPQENPQKNRPGANIALLQGSPQDTAGMRGAARQIQAMVGKTKLFLVFCTMLPEGQPSVNLHNPGSIQFSHCQTHASVVFLGEKELE